MRRHGATPSVKRRSRPSGEGDYAQEGYASELYRHYAIPGGVKARKLHCAGGLVVGKTNPPGIGAGVDREIL